MLRLTWRIATVLAVGSLAAGPAFAAHHEEEEKKDKQEKAEQAEDAQTAAVQPPIMIAAMPVFVPTNMGAPAARLGGATRAVGDDEHPNIEALVPEAVGHTLSEQPNLYWYLDGTGPASVEFVLRAPASDETLVTATLPTPKQPGVQRIALADHGVKLEPGVEYFWMVKLVRNPKDRAYDKITGGGIERVGKSDELAQALAAEGASRPHVLAGAGIWYDAVDELSTQLASAPGNRTLWNQRAALFEQVGLPAIALEDSAASAYQRR